MHVKEYSVVPYPAAPTRELTLERSDISGERIFSHLSHGCENAALIFRRNTFKFFLRAACDAKMPAHWRVDPVLRSARA
jgi:hypothetical protein